jgi:hypothetical protein
VVPSDTGAARIWPMDTPSCTSITGLIASAEKAQTAISTKTASLISPSCYNGTDAE